MILDTFFVIIILSNSFKQFLVGSFKQFKTVSNNFKFNIFQENFITNKLLLLLLLINNYLVASLL